MIEVGKARTFKKGSLLSRLDKLIIPDIFPQDINEARLESVGSVPGNGRAEIRLDGSFAKKYKYEMLRTEGRGNTVTGIRILGYATTPGSRTSIPKEVRDIYRDKPCMFLGLLAGGMEIDHKDGWSCQGSKVEDFQPICKAANNSKRYYCNDVCKPNGNRFDARRLGFSVGWTKGGSIRTQEVGCRGCYLFDPVEFRKAFKIKS